MAELVHDKFPDIVGSFDAHYTAENGNVEWKTFFSLEDFFLWALTKNVEKTSLLHAISHTERGLAFSYWNIRCESGDIRMYPFKVK